MDSHLKLQFQKRDVGKKRLKNNSVVSCSRIGVCAGSDIRDQQEATDVAMADAILEQADANTDDQLDVGESSSDGERNEPASNIDATSEEIKDEL